MWSEVNTMSYVVGIDIGGTFTDSVAIDKDGILRRAKSLTTPADLSDGVMRSLDALATTSDQALETFLADVKLAVVGSTTAVNVMAELRGPKLGLITTKGAEDTVRIARSYRHNTYDLHQQVSPPELVSRPATLGVTERIDYKGRVVVPLDREEVENALHKLIDKQNVEGLAVSFLWSPRNPEHELAVGRIVEDLYPEIRYSLSHQVYPGIREYERTMTTLINAYVTPATADHIDVLKVRMREAGFGGRLTLMHSMGGVVEPEEMAKLPVKQILSGPVGGVCGANYLGRLTGTKNIITADVGGTSFDTSLIHDNELRVLSRTYIRAPGNPGPGYLTGLSLIDIAAIGAGGGSIAWLDPRGLLRMGPHSAGSDPGPVAFGRGGREPTLTDACLVLGILDPDFYLGGAIHVDADAALAAIEEKVARPLGVTPHEAASMMYEVLVATMSSNVRAVSIRKGFDPRDFTLMSYGGAGGMILPAVCKASHVRELVVPANAATFSAFGLLTTDYKRDYLATVHWRPGDDPSELNLQLEKLEREARRDIEAAGFVADDAVYQFEVEMRFVGQFFELAVPVRSLPLSDAELERLVSAFNARYEQEYGEGTGWIGAPVEMIHARLSAIAKLPSFHLQTLTTGSTSAAEAMKGERTVYSRATRTHDAVAVYDYARLSTGVTLDGPAIIEGTDTTVHLLASMRSRVDEYGSLRVQVEAAS
jgi:N-methylhydantoinase A